MSNRRTFLGTIAGSMASVAFRPADQPPGDDAIAVRAEPSVFWRHPAPHVNLVRFLVTGTEVSAGRLRVYDRARRLLGTAGMLRTGDALRGELWLALDEPTSIMSELEIPGRRAPLRTGHRLAPPGKWTLVWLTVTDSDELERRLHALPSLDRLVLTAIWREAGVIVNPLPLPIRLYEMDHLPFLRAAALPDRVPAALGLPTAAVALVGPLDRYPATTPLALSGAGVRRVVRTDGSSQPAWWSSPDGSRVLAVPLADDADPVTLGFSDGGTTMAGRIEGFLEVDATPPAGWTRVIVQAGLGDGLGRMMAAVQEWNRTYAFPRIEIGGAAGADRTLTVASDVATMAPAASALELPRPASSELVRVIVDRARATDRQAENMLAPIANLLGMDSAERSAVRRIAASIDTRVPGWLVVNPTPFRRTDVVRLHDGRFQVVTDVPALGYAFVLDDGVRPEPEAAASPMLAGSQMDVMLDPSTGALRSLRDKRTRREWLRGVGANDAVAIVESWEQRVIPGIARQLVARRHSAYHGDLMTVVTAYDRLPWIEIENCADHPEREQIDYAFDFAVPNPTVRWEIPAGHHEGVPPLRYVPYVRWLTLDGTNGSVLIGGAQTPYAAIGGDGRVEFPGTPGTTRFRILVSSSTPATAECARFGWDLEPLRVVPVAGTTAGPAERFGHAVVLDQPDAALIGLKTADDGDGVVAYVQNLTPEVRFVSIGFGLLAWSDAQPVDLREQRIDAALTAVPDGVAFDVAPWGVSAIRLTGVRLRGQ